MYSQFVLCEVRTEFFNVNHMKFMIKMYRYHSKQLIFTAWKKLFNTWKFIVTTSQKLYLLLEKFIVTTSKISVEVSLFVSITRRPTGGLDVIKPPILPFTQNRTSGQEIPRWGLHETQESSSAAPPLLTPYQWATFLVRRITLSLVDTDRKHSETGDSFSEVASN
jgi:hypothetical protein